VVFEIADAGAIGPTGYLGLRMFDADTGAFLGSVGDPVGRPFNSFFRSQAAVVDGTVYVPTADPLFGSVGSNRVDAFRLP